MSLPPYPCLGAQVDGACPETPTYPSRECTSGGAWWGSQITGKPWPQGWGNADNWPAAARAAGMHIDLTPAINSIMCIPPNTNGAGPKGHIAVVIGNPVGDKAPVWEMNFLTEHGFDFRSAPTHGCEYIHLVIPIPTPTQEELDVYFLVTIQGDPNAGVYRLGGGFYVGVSTPADAAAFRAAGDRSIVISAGQHQRYLAAAPKP